MPSLSRATTAFSRNSSWKSSGGTASALPIVNTPSASFDVKDVEACRSESEAIPQEPSNTTQKPFGLFLILEQVWRNASLLILSIIYFWRKPELDEYWNELPQKVKYEDIREYTKGIPRLAAFFNSDDNFCIWRSFGQLHSRVLIQKTLELNALEKELEDLDAQDDQAEETRYRLQIGEHYDGWDPTQKDLIDKISGKLADYDDLMLKHNTIKSLPKPSKSNYESILIYIWKTRPISEGHFDFAFKIQDFVRLGLRPQNAEFHDRLLRWVSRWSESPLNKMFRDPEQPQDATATVQYYLSHRLDFVIKSFITFLIISILMVPVLLLFLVPMGKSIMAVVVLISLFVFTISLSLFRDSRPQDIFFGTATYCAVLLVFLAGQTNMYGIAATGA